MVLYLGTIVLAALVVVVTRGSFRRLGQIELRWLWLLFVALAIQVVLEFVTFPKARIDDVGFGLLMLSFALIVTFCILNVRTSGFLIIAVGVGLNMLVIGLNQGMPTKDEVHVRNGREVHVPIERTVKHRPQESDDKLVFLSDQLTVPGIPNVDVLGRRHRDRARDRRRVLRSQPSSSPVRRLSRPGRRTSERRGHAAVGVGLSTPRRSSTISSAPRTCSS